MAKWFELPCDILERISRFCIIHDRIRMQYVCKSWWSILKNTNRELPWLMMLPNDNEEDPDARDLFSLSKQKIHTVHLPEIRGKRCCGSFKNGWLMIVDENLDIFLFHPWSKRRIDLPHHSTVRICSMLGSSGEEIRDQGIVKAAVSDDGKVVVIAYGLGLWFLAFCRIGDDVYTHIDFELAVEDVIYHKGNFYLFTGRESLYLLHIEEEEEGSSPHIEKLTVDLKDDFNIPYRIFGYLVPDVLTDRMFVITRDVVRIGEGNDGDEEEDLPHKTIHFDIFEVSLEESKTLKRFKKVENLVDRVLFLGHNSPFVVMASQFQGFKGNRIYFADDRAERYYDSPHGCRDSGVFSLEDGTVEELFADRFHPTLSPPLWIATPPYSSSSEIFEKWSSILKKKNRELPWLMMLPNDNEEDSDARDFFSLSNQKIHTFHLPEIRGKRCCGSFKNGWLMIVDENLDIFLFHPWSKRRIDLPHHSTVRIYSMLGSSGEEIRDQGIVKAAVSDDGKVVVIAYGLGLWFLAFCRIGDDVYTHIDFELAVVDVIYHKGNFYLFTGHESLYLLHIEEEDGTSPHIAKLTVDLKYDFKIPYRIYGYLVPDVLTDSMFVITRDVVRIGEGNDRAEEEDLPHKTIHFDIFEVSLEESKTLKRFKKVENLGDRVLFLGHNSPFVVMASQFQGFKGNRICFADNMERYYDSPHGCRDLGVFSLEDGTVEELFADRFHPTLSPPLWIATPPYSSSVIFEESSYAYEVST